MQLHGASSKNDKPVDNKPSPTKKVNSMDEEENVTFDVPLEEYLIGTTLRVEQLLTVNLHATRHKQISAKFLGDSLMLIDTICNII